MCVMDFSCSIFFFFSVSLFCVADRCTMHEQLHELIFPGGRAMLLLEPIGGLFTPESPRKETHTHARST